MKRLAIVLAVLASFTALAETDFTLRFPPNPPRYLKQIPLGEITDRDLLDQLGIPQNKIEIDGETRWQYERVDPQNGVRQSLTYVLSNGLVVDVIYNASGCPFGRCPYNGDTAKDARK